MEPNSPSNNKQEQGDDVPPPVSISPSPFEHENHHQNEALFSLATTTNNSVASSTTTTCSSSDVTTTSNNVTPRHQQEDEMTQDEDMETQQSQQDISSSQEDEEEEEEYDDEEQEYHDNDHSNEASPHSRCATARSTAPSKFFVPSEEFRNLNPTEQIMVLAEYALKSKYSELSDLVLVVPFFQALDKGGDVNATIPVGSEQVSVLQVLVDKLHFGCLDQFVAHHLACLRLHDPSSTPSPEQLRQFLTSSSPSLENLLVLLSKKLQDTFDELKSAAAALKAAETDQKFLERVYNNYKQRLEAAEGDIRELKDRVERIRQQVQVKWSYIRNSARGLTAIINSENSTEDQIEEAEGLLRELTTSAVDAFNVWAFRKLRERNGIEAQLDQYDVDHEKEMKFHRKECEHGVVIWHAQSKMRDIERACDEMFKKFQEYQATILGLGFAIESELLLRQYEKQFPQQQHVQSMSSPLPRPPHNNSSVGGNNNNNSINSSLQPVPPNTANQNNNTNSVSKDGTSLNNNNEGNDNDNTNNNNTSHPSNNNTSGTRRQRGE